MSIDATLFGAVKVWAKSHGKSYQVIRKGLYPHTEHFGIFSAQVPVDGEPSTQPNMELIARLNQSDRVVIAGEAKSHCVATSIQQAMDLSPKLAGKMVILQDCMSDVTGLGHLGDPIYERAKQAGIAFKDSTE